MVKDKILIVDDEEDIIELLRYNLAREGYDIFAAATGEEALVTADSQPVNLIVLDLMLPGIDGLEVLRRIKTKNNTQSVPIILLTAKGEEADVVAGLELGADDYVTKPFSPRIPYCACQGTSKEATHGNCSGTGRDQNTRFRHSCWTPQRLW